MIEVGKTYKNGHNCDCKVVYRDTSPNAKGTRREFLVVCKNPIFPNIPFWHSKTDPIEKSAIWCNDQGKNTAH